MPISPLRSDTLEVPDDLAEFQSYFFERGWADGLPVIPPTEERVIAMIDGSGRAADQSIGIVPPLQGEATVEKIAVNAVMAGCLPEYMPVIITAMEAMLQEAFNLYAIQGTTNPVAPMLIVNGPIVKEIGLNSGRGAFGPGSRSNATIGRAVRLCLLNIGGGYPGVGDMALQGIPGKYTWCVAENEQESPWEPLHVERGFRAEESCVTVVSATGTLNVLGIGGVSVVSIANAMAYIGSKDYLFGGEPFIALNPGHALRMAQDGMSKADVKRELWKMSAIPFERFAAKDLIRAARKAEFPDLSDPTPITIAKRPDDVMVFVVGATGAHSQYIPCYGDTRSVTRRIQRP